MHWDTDTDEICSREDKSVPVAAPWIHQSSIRLGETRGYKPSGEILGFFSRNLIDQLAPPTSTNTGIWMNKCSLIYYSQEESPKGFVVSWKIINVLFSIV